jgi:hypothetical protein
MAGATNTLLDNMLNGFWSNSRRVSKGVRPTVSFAIPESNLIVLRMLPKSRRCPHLGWHFESAFHASPVISTSCGVCSWHTICNDTW